MNGYLPILEKSVRHAYAIAASVVTGAAGIRDGFIYLDA
jgi:hypothetical protein